MIPAPKVVLVESDGAVRSSLKFALELEGFTVEALESVDHLITTASLPASGCLIIDHGTAGEDGIATLATLRRAGCTLPAIITATHPSRSFREAVAQAGAALVEKPLLGDTLSNLLWTLIEPPLKVA